MRRVVQTAQHLHGGFGADVDYPLHHYHARAKHLELTLGPAAAHEETSGTRWPPIHPPDRTRTKSRSRPPAPGNYSTCPV